MVSTLKHRVAKTSNKKRIDWNFWLGKPKQGVGYVVLSGLLNVVLAVWVLPPLQGYANADANHAIETRMTGWYKIEPQSTNNKIKLGELNWIPVTTTNRGQFAWNLPSSEKKYFLSVKHPNILRGAYFSLAEDSAEFIETDLNGEVKYPLPPMNSEDSVEVKIALALAFGIENQNKIISFGIIDATCKDNAGCLSQNEKEIDFEINGELASAKTVVLSSIDKKIQSDLIVQEVTGFLKSNDLIQERSKGGNFGTLEEDIIYTDNPNYEILWQLKLFFAERERTLSIKTFEEYRNDFEAGLLAPQPDTSWDLSQQNWDARIRLDASLMYVNEIAKNENKAADVIITISNP